MPEQVTGAQIKEAAHLNRRSISSRSEARMRSPLPTTWRSQSIMVRSSSLPLAWSQRDPPPHPASDSGLGRNLRGSRVTPHEMPDGSVWATVHGCDLGPGWSLSAIDLSVKLVVSFPDTPPYPWYLPGDVTRTDGHVVDRLAAPCAITESTAANCH